MESELCRIDRDIDKNMQKITSKHRTSSSGKVKDIQSENMTENTCIQSEICSQRTQIFLHPSGGDCLYM